ncbi:segregation and condensation protein a [hydrocarbon metagenome]|uniref:Segregation and condensation protein a n=1 Tax=hydrocarbon metagenome TaxID=938273 RepID=A0A0W8FET1_9ZZZZ
MDEEPVEILVGMAERGEIDPWNIDIVDVTDRFFAELERRKELDLRISGRTLFYAASLLRMKSEYLDLQGLPEEAEPCEDEDDALPFDLDSDFGLDEIGEPIARLEREIQRRIGRKNLRSRPVTLYELIKQLKTAEKEERRRIRRQKAAFREPDPDLRAEEVVGLAHDEGYRQAVEVVMQQVMLGADRSGPLTLSELSGRMGWKVRDVYIPLLFLMLEGRAVLWQEDFFGDVFVVLPGQSED